MIVGIDASRANKSKRTGTEWYSYHLIQELKRIIPSHVTVRLYTREPLSDGLEVLPANWEMCVLRWPPKYFWTLVRLSLEMLRHPPDVLFVPAHGLPLVLPRAVVTTIHDIGFDRFPKLYKKRQVIYHRFAVRRSVKKCQRIITISNFTRRELEQLYGPLHVPVVVIPLAHDHRRFFSPLPVAALPPVLARYKIQRPYFFFIGRLERKKNIIGILEAFAQMAETNTTHDLVLAGLWGNGRDECEALLRRPELNNRVHILSWIPEDDVSALMAAATALVFPTFYEGFGLPIVQAMAVGTPVITSKGGAHEEVAATAALIVDPHGTKAIARAMSTLVSDQAQVDQLRAAGLVRAKLFSWQRVGEATWEVLQQVYQSKSRG